MTPAEPASKSASAAAAANWRKPPMIRQPLLRWALILAGIIYLIAALSTLGVDVQRLAEGIPRGLRFLAGFFPPDFTSRGELIYAGVLESVAMAVVSTAIGVVISIPVALGAARNLSPWPIYYACRGLIVVSRSFQEVILAILFVAIVGFGPLAGIITLSFATIGFFAKLLAEEIEGTGPATLAALQATGATQSQTWFWAILPQVKPRMVGLTLYRLDINFRESAIIGIVGAGGIGDVLQASFDRYEFDTTAAILLTIIAIVVAMEYGSSLIRRRML